MKQFIKFVLTMIIILITIGLVLTSCSKTPTSSLIEQHVQLVNDTIDYAQNNMSDDADTKMLINSLKTCKTGLLSAEQTYKGEISTCKSERDYWRLASIVMFVLLCGIVFAKIKRKFL